MTANICMSNENDKYNFEQRIANFLFTLWKQVPKWYHYLQFGWQEALQIDFSEPNYASDLQFMVIEPKLLASN